MDGKTAEDIDKRIAHVLKDMGICQPPIRVEDVIRHLKVHHSYYSLEDPDLLQEVFHRLRIGGSKLKGLTKKLKLQGLWLPDSNKILVDISVKEKKRKWVNAHEVAHKIIPTHNQFLQGDTAETLDPDYHEMLEAEANYGASALIFLGKLFTVEALQVSPCFDSVVALHKRYQNTLATTLRRFVQYSHDIPMLGVISSPFWKPLPEGQPSLCRYFVPSPKFLSEFSNVEPEEIQKRINGYVSPRKGGMVGVTTLDLVDDNGETHEFSAESFFTQYDILTLIAHKRKKAILIAP